MLVMILMGNAIFILKGPNYFSRGYVDVAVRMQYRRVDCYAFSRYSASRKVNEMYVVPKLFVIFDFSIMTYYVRYRSNFQVKNLVFTYQELLSMGSVCLECIDVERFVVGVSLLRSIGVCLVEGKTFQLIPFLLPLKYCDSH